MLFVLIVSVLLLANGVEAISSLDALSTWQCNPQDGSVSQNGVTVDASVPCNWGITGPNQQAEATASPRCAGAKMLAAIEKKDGERVTLRLEGLFQPPVSSRTVEI